MLDLLVKLQYPIKATNNKAQKTPVSQRRLKQKRMKKNIITVL